MKSLAEAQLRACKLWPYGSHAILSLVPVSKTGLGTLAVDQHWRLYFVVACITQESRVKRVSSWIKSVVLAE